MDELRGKTHGLDDGKVICGSTTDKLISEKCGRLSQSTHVTTEVKPKGEASTIKCTLESPKILC